MKSNRCGILQFCGSDTKVEFDVDGDEGKYCFRKLENGQFKNGEVPKTRHPNILRSVMIGKKSLGLWIKEWSQGINDFSFTREEILNEFKKFNIEIPESFLKDFDNVIEKGRLKRIEEEIKRRNL